MKKGLIAIGVIIGIFQLAVIVVYFRLFNGGISSSHQDWDTFLQIFNGFVMAILTAVNIYIFYQLTVAIEDKNHTRAVKEKVFEAQSVLTQMRVKKYEDVSSLIYDVMTMILTQKSDNGEVLLLKKKLTEIDGSLLFKNNNLKDAPMMENLSVSIMTDLDNVMNTHSDSDLQSLIASVTNYLRIMEVYIVGQMIIDTEVGDYVINNKNNIDCTISCVSQVLEGVLEAMEKGDKQESLNILYGQ